MRALISSRTCSSVSPCLAISLAVLLVAPFEELLLQFVEALLDLLVRDLDVQLLGLERELGALDEAADDAVAQSDVLGRPGLRELLALRLRSSPAPA